MVLEALLRFRRELFDARNRNEIDDKTLNDVLTLLDAIEIILRDMRDAECRDVVDSELRKVLILIRRKLRNLYQKKEICDKCYNEILRILQDLELKLEEYEYEEALRRWG